MGRPLQIQKYGSMQGVFTTGPTADAVALDQGYNPFAAPTALDTNTTVVPQPATTPVPFTGVVGGQRGGAVSATYPVVEVQVNIQLVSGSGAGVHNGIILRQKGARKFLVQDLTAIQDEGIVAGNSYIITSLGSTNWTLFGAPAGAVVGTTFTATANGSNSGNGVCNLIGQCVLVNSGSPTAGNMSITMAVGGDSTAVYISKLTNKFVQDFNGGETGGNANTGDVWAETDVVNDIAYAANFFTDESTFAKSGADVATWVGTEQPGDNGTLELAQVEKYTS